MNMNLFAGWRDVFSFTLNQTSKGKFKKTTGVMTIISLIIGMAISIIMAFVQEDSDTQISSVEKVYVCNESDLDVLDFSRALTDEERYPNVSFLPATQSAKELIASNTLSSKDVVITVANNSEGYEADIVLLPESEITKNEAEDLLGEFESVMETGKVMSSGIEEEKLEAALSPALVNKILAGEQVKSLGEEVLAEMLPMLIAFLLYFVLLIYGSGMGNTMSVEKTSKLMESILTMTRPYALVLGKITALTASAIIQIAALIIGFVAGFFAGDFIAYSFIYPGYENYVIEVLRLMKVSGLTGAFTPFAVSMFAVTLVLSILFYSFLAATCGSFAGTTEEVASYMIYFQMSIIAGFFAAIMLPSKGSASIDTILRIIPITSAFVLPGDILMGKITPGASVLYMLLLLIFSLAAALFAGKVYLNRIFYRGKK